MAKEIQVPIDGSLIKKIALRFGSENEDVIAGVEAYLFYGVMHHEDVLRFYSPKEATLPQKAIVPWEEWERERKKILKEIVDERVPIDSVPKRNVEEGTGKPT